MTTRIALLAIAGLLAGLASASALAHGGYYGGGHPRARVGIHIGVPLWWGPRYYYPPPYYYPYHYPPVVVVPQSPPVYIERGDAQAAPEPESSNWWYYCSNPSGYYPYVKQCPGGWQRVAPQPPPS